MRTMTAILLATCAANAAGAQLYRSVDAEGRVEWRDTPPSAAARQVEERKVQGNVISSAGAPYAVQRAAKDFPVTLWTTACGPVCDKAKGHLARRGIPYTEKDAKAEAGELVKMIGTLEVPVLVVGKTQVKGYSQASWDSALDAAGYPSARATGTP